MLDLEEAGGGRSLGVAAAMTIDITSNTGQIHGTYKPRQRAGGRVLGSPLCDPNFDDDDWCGYPEK